MQPAEHTSRDQPSTARIIAAHRWQTQASKKQQGAEKHVDAELGITRANARRRHLPACAAAARTGQPISVEK
jgi:hypothetical protein